VDFLRILRIRLARIGYCRASVPTSVPKPTRRVPQISIADDIIAIEDAARLVTAQFHRDAFGNAGADHVPDGRATEFVRDAARAAGGDPGAAPGVVEAAGEVLQDVEESPLNGEDDVLKPARNGSTPEDLSLERPSRFRSC